MVSQDRRDSVGGEMRAVDDLMQDGQERENGGQPLAVSQVEGQKLVSERKVKQDFLRQGRLVDSYNEILEKACTDF